MKKKTFERIKDKEKVKTAAFFASLAVLLILPVIALKVKLGIVKWRTYDTPITWSDFFSQLPFFIVWGVLIFIGVFFIQLHTDRADDPVVICTKCLTPFYKKHTTDDICPNCNAQLEPINGFYDRHPELRD